MNIVKRINQTLEDWTDGFRGGGAKGLQPQDVLRYVVLAMEKNRVTGLDGTRYVPNAYEVELLLVDTEESARLLPFLGREELMAALGRHCQERGYALRGPLTLQLYDGTGNEAADEDGRQPRTGKVQVHCRYDVVQISPCLSCGVWRRVPILCAVLEHPAKQAVWRMAQAAVVSDISPTETTLCFS